MKNVIEMVGVTRRYRQVTALHQVSFALPANSITGLLGRNGAGKSTLMKIIAGQDFPSSGSVTVFGQVPFETESVQGHMSFVKEGQVYPDMSIKNVIRAASWFYPNWDSELAGLLTQDFELPEGRRMKKVSRGMHSAVGIIIGLASRADITLFDEPYLGLDAVARQIFYDRLLADFTENPRTIVLSTHLIDEVAKLLEHVVILDRGQVLLDAPVEDALSAAVTVSGRSKGIDEFVKDRTVLRRESLGSLTAVTIAGGLTPPDRQRLSEFDIQVSPVSLQDLLVHLTNPAGVDKVGAAQGIGRHAGQELSA